MTVRDCIRKNGQKKIKYRVDNTIFDLECHIPEDIKNLEVKSYIFFMTDEMYLWMRSEKTHKDSDCFNINKGLIKEIHYEKTRLL